MHCLGAASSNIRAMIRDSTTPLVENVAFETIENQRNSIENFYCFRHVDLDICQYDFVVAHQLQ